MSKNILSISIIILFHCSLKVTPSNDRSNYGNDLSEFIAKNELLPDSAVSYIIPRTANEFGLFYSYYANKETYSSFVNIFDQIKRSAYNKDSDCFENYLLMYEFINPDILSEEFLEDMFYSIDILIENNTNKFCLFFNKLEGAERISLMEFYEMYCE